MEYSGMFQDRNIVFGQIKVAHSPINLNIHTLFGVVNIQNVLSCVLRKGIVRAIGGKVNE